MCAATVQGLLKDTLDRAGLRDVAGQPLQYTARLNGWEGEVQALQVSLDAAQARVTALNRVAAQGTITQLGLPVIRNS